MEIMNTIVYPKSLELPPAANPISASVTVPGSKSITNRALVLAALASRLGECKLMGALQSEDTEVMVEGLTRLGFRIEVDWPRVAVYKNESGRLVPNASADIFCANSGTTMRFLTAVCAAGNGRYRLDGVPRMRERPIEDLLGALRELGVKAHSENGNGCPPAVIETSGLIQRRCAVRSDQSSQFLSALMMVAPYHSEGHGIWIHLKGALVSEPYIEMTLAMIARWNLPYYQNFDSRVEDGEPNRRQHITSMVFEQKHLHGGPLYSYVGPAEYAIEPDASAASYFWAAAAVTGGRVTVLGLTRDSLQGDVAFVDALEKMGCSIDETADGIAAHGGALKGIDIDMNAISDTAMTLAAVALFAEGPTTIRNIAHVRHKETDRIAAVATELRKLGATVEEFDDGMRIVPGPLTGCSVATYNDHRMAMSLAIVGLKVPGVKIENPGCVAKTYPGFWQDWARMSE